MIRFACVLLSCVFALASGGAAAAQQLPAEATPAPLTNQFNDPAMSFTAPPDYKPIPVPQPKSTTDFAQPTVVAAFVKYPGQRNQRIITITMQSFTDPLESFITQDDQAIRQHADSVFFQTKDLTQLSNGMPAYWEVVNMGTGFQEMFRYQYVWVDGARGVTAALIAGYGQIESSQARKDLSALSAVAYPTNRY
jgi:hypothetical protein